MPELEFNPINPIELSEERFEEYYSKLEEARWLEPGIAPNIYNGSEQLRDLVERGIIGVGVILRLNIFEGDDPYLIVRSKGLQNYLFPERGIKSPEEALDITGADGKICIWEIEAQEFIESE